MIKFCKKVVCTLVAAAVVLPTGNIGVYAAPAQVVSCYADTDEIVLTYDGSADITDNNLSLVLDGSEVGINAAVEDDKVVLTPLSGNFQRDVVYTISDGSYISNFMIKTLIDGINKDDLSTYDGSKGNANGRQATVFIDSDADGVEELFCTNSSSLFFKNNDAKTINSTENYTVKYDLASYAITSDREAMTLKPSEYYNVIVNSMRFNASSENANSAPDGFMLYRSNWQPIKYLSGNSWVDSGIKPADAGLSGFTDNQDGSTAKHGTVFYDNGVSDIEIISPAETSVGIKMKKIGNAGTLYIDGTEKLTQSQGSSSRGYFIFGGGESSHTFIQMKNFVATTCVTIADPEELIPQSYHGDRSLLKIEFNEAIPEITSGNIKLTNGDDEIPIDVEMNGSTALIKPLSGEFPRDVVLRATVSEDFGDDSYRTDAEFYRDFKIETVQSTIDESTFGKKSSTKLYKNGKVYFTSDYISPLNASPYLSEYSISFKLRPFFVENPTILNNVASLYMRISFNNEIASRTQTNKGSAWNFQNYEQFLTHTNWDEEQQNYKTDWGHQYGNWSDMGLPTRNDLVEVSFANNDVNFINEPSYEPVDVRIDKSGNSGTITIGNVTDTLTTLNDTGYFVIAQYQPKYSVVEVSDFVMTVYREYSPVNVVGNTESIETNASVCVDLHGVATGDIGSAVTLTDTETGESLDGYECTLSSDKTKLYISEPCEWVRGRRIAAQINTQALGVEDAYWQSVQEDFYDFEFSVGNGDIYSVINNANVGNDKTDISVRVINKTGEAKDIYMIAALYGENSELIGMSTNEFSVSDTETTKQISVSNNGKTVRKVKIHMLNSASDAKPYCEAAIREVK